VVREVECGADGKQEVTEYASDAAGNRTVTRDGQVAGRTENTIEGTLRVRTVTAEDGSRTIIRASAGGRVAEEESIGPDGATRHATRRKTVYGYDEQGRRNYARTPEGLVTRSTFDAAGREVQTVTELAGQSWTARRGYDPAGRLAWEATPAQWAENKRTIYVYADKNYPDPAGPGIAS
jgi:YD repeat-containing protein